jgi:polysaccharide biosynthesis protein PslG
MHRSKHILARLVLALILLIVAGCSPAAPPVLTPTPEQEARTPRPTFTPLAPEAPSPTPTPLDPTVAAPAPVTLYPEAPSTVTAPAARLPRMNSPEYGMQAFMWWRPEVASRDAQIIREAGFGWVKLSFGWRDIEGAGKGLYDWSRADMAIEMALANGLDIVVRVDYQPAWAGGGFPVTGPPDRYQDLADFFTVMATRYRGHVRAYQVWNEPNLAREWGDRLPNPDEYVRLLGLCYQAIKAADPNAMVISAGLSPTGSWTNEARPDDWYLESMYIAMGGSSDGYFDVLGAHGAGFLSPPERDPAEVAANPALGGHRSMAFRRVEDLRAIMVKYGDADKQIALLEFGWTSDPRPDSPYNWHAVSEAVKAEYLVRAYQYARQNWSPWIGLMSLIYVADHEWTEADEQYWWAITEPGWPDFIPRPAYRALQSMIK